MLSSISFDDRSSRGEQKRAGERMIDLTENGGAQVFAVRSCSDSRLLCTV